MSVREIYHAHLFGGIGGGARGFNASQARVGKVQARFVCLGSIDVDRGACNNFARLVGAPATCLDLFDRAQYVAFHGREPPDDWREATPDDVRRAFQNIRPNIIFLSAPCKGFSGLLSETMSGSAKYQALNRLTLRGMWLALEAYKDDPVELIIFENVPRIATRGRPLLDQIDGMGRAYGYAIADTVHDCGVIGRLAQSRKRFLKVMRHQAKVPNFLYQPDQHKLRGIGEVIGKLPLPLPGCEAWNPMHRMPALTWKTWVRLAFVEAGSDWRSLNRLAVEHGVLKDFGIEADTSWRGGVLGVRPWDQPIGVIAGESSPTNGAFSVADPRIDGHAKSVQLGVRPWSEPSGVVTGKMFAGGGPHSVADPRIEGNARFNNCFRIVRRGDHSPVVADPRAAARPRSTQLGVRLWDEPTGVVAGESFPTNGAFAVADPRTGFGPDAHKVMKVTPWDDPGGTITSQRSPGAGALCVADPRCDGYSPNAHRNKLKVIDWDAASFTVTGGKHVQSGGLSVADPRPAALNGEHRDGYATQGHYGVMRWEETTGGVTASGQHDNGRWSVADPRPSDSSPSDEAAKTDTLPGATDRLVCVIHALDDTWHRPLTTLELAALQSLIDPEEQFYLDTTSDSMRREWIGNCVPPDSATAVGNVMGRTLLAAWGGETFMLSAEPIWVRPIAVALMAAQGGLP